MTERTASCSCGRIGAVARGDPLRVSVCHCLACQRRTGSVFGVQARFRREDVTLRGEGTEYVRIGDEGSTARFTFCPACGATVWYVFDGHDDVIALPVGAFADPAFPAPAFSVYEDRKHAWVTLPANVEHLG
jgi:hypothetical protein